MNFSGETVETQVEILNSHGLHLRPVMKFVDIANRFNSTVRVDKGDGTEAADGKSPMALMILEAPRGTTLRIMATGPDADDVVNALVELVNEKFGEE